MPSYFRIPLLMALLICVACGGSGVAAENSAAPPEAQAQASEVGPVTRVVFIGVEKACACTMRTIEAVDKALSTSLEGREVEVERLFLDREEHREDAASYRDIRRFSVAPALFFFDDNSRLVEMTQGPVGEEDLRKILE